MTQATAFALDFDTAYEIVSDLISDARLGNVEHLDFMEGSFEAKGENLLVTIPVYADLTNTQGVFIEGMPFISRGELSPTGTVLHFEIFDVIPLPSTKVTESFDTKGFMRF